MAFLKSSRITGISARDVAVRGFRQSNNIKLGTRAYTRHEVLLADSYDIVGDVTVSDDLILSKLSDDGDDIIITGDTTTRTISGSGSIQGATLAQTPNASLAGMTGTLDNSVQDNVTRLGTVTTGSIDPGVTGVQHPFNATSWPAFAVSVADNVPAYPNVSTTYQKVGWSNDSGDGTAPTYLGDHLFNIGGFFDLDNDWFLPTVAGYYCFSYYTNLHNVGADRRYNVRFVRSTDGTDDWYDRFFVASEQTSTSEQTNFGFTSGPVYMNGTSHRVFLMHQIHSGSYNFNEGSHQMGFRGWRVG